MKRNYNPQNDEATSRPRKNVTPLPQEFKDDIREAVNVMRRGGIILYPTTRFGAWAAMPPMKRPSDEFLK